MTPTRLSLLAVAALPLLAGCSAETTKTIDKDEIAKQAQGEFDRIAKAKGQRFPKIVCPDDLEGEAGKKTRCTATGPDGTLGITVTVKSADGDNAQLNFKGDDKVTK